MGVGRRERTTKPARVRRPSRCRPAGPQGYGRDAGAAGVRAPPPGPARDRRNTRMAFATSWWFRKRGLAVTDWASVYGGWGRDRLGQCLRRRFAHQWRRRPRRQERRRGWWTARGWRDPAPPSTPRRGAKSSRNDEPRGTSHSRPRRHGDVEQRDTGVPRDDRWSAEPREVSDDAVDVSEHVDHPDHRAQHDQDQSDALNRLQPQNDASTVHAANADPQRGRGENPAAAYHPATPPNDGRKRQASRHPPIKEAATRPTTGGYP